MAEDEAGPRQAGVALLFRPGTRPDADSLERLAMTAGQGEATAGVGFSISHRPAERPYWLELLALGLTFDLQGLAPGIPAEAAPAAHAFALPLAEGSGLEPLVLRPGPHLSAGANLVPVIRAMAALACELARLPGLVAVGWLPARAIMSPAYFLQVVTSWLKGGVFPGLGLTALVRLPTGQVRTDGLTFFIGQEILVDPLDGEAPADTAKFVLRLIHDLVENGPYSCGAVTGPGGVALHCAQMPDRGTIRIVRDTRPPA